MQHKKVEPQHSLSTSCPVCTRPLKVVSMMTIMTEVCRPQRMHHGWQQMCISGLHLRTASTALVRIVQGSCVGNRGCARALACSGCAYLDLTCILPEQLSQELHKVGPQSWSTKLVRLQHRQHKVFTDSD